MKKALVFGLLSCLLFSAEGMNKKLSSSSSKSSSEQLTLSPKIQGEFFLPKSNKNTMDPGWGYKAVCNRRCSYIELLFCSQGEATEASNRCYETNVKVSKKEGIKTLEYGNVERVENTLKIYVMSNNINRLRTVTYFIQSVEPGTPQPIKCEFCCEE